MSNSEKLLKIISSLIENGILTSKDLKKEISTDLKFKKDKILNKLNLVSREEFEVIKKMATGENKRKRNVVSVRSEKETAKMSTRRMESSKSSTFQFRIFMREISEEKKS